jgi:hypothetical protein
MAETGGQLNAAKTAERTLRYFDHQKQLTIYPKIDLIRCTRRIAEMGKWMIMFFI